MYPLDDTIAAIASPPGGAARGIVRISGPQAIDRLMQFFQPDGERAGSASKGTVSFSSTTAPPQCPRKSGQSLAGSLRLPELHSPLPCDAYLWPDGRSYTGQPVAEIHTIGSPPLLDLVLRSLCAAGARLAGPGEFTLRAFLAGRIDLTQAEAVLGVIDAVDPQELRVALGQLAGNLARPLDRLRDKLLNLLADVEAGFDFADENLETIAPDELHRQLAAAENDIAAIERQMASRCEPFLGIRVVLTGRPNTGKSSLFNALAGHHAALVSDHPGTTRDYLVAELDLDGVKCQLIDTAGGEERGERNEEREERNEGWAVHRPLNCSITTATQSTTAAQRRSAHLQLLCLDATRPLDALERDELKQNTVGQPIVVLTKCDAARRTDCDYPALETSSVSGCGIAELRTELRRRALAAGEHHGDAVASTALRCAESLRLAGQCLQRARQIASAGQEELAAAEMRAALEELGKVIGAVYTEDVLDRIFSRFCVGK